MRCCQPCVEAQLEECGDGIRLELTKSCVHIPSWAETQKPCPCKNHLAALFTFECDINIITPMFMDYVIGVNNARVCNVTEIECINAQLDAIAHVISCLSWRIDISESSSQSSSYSSSQEKNYSWSDGQGSSVSTALSSGASHSEAQNTAESEAMGSAGSASFGYGFSRTFAESESDTASEGDSTSDSTGSGSTSGTSSNFDYGATWGDPDAVTYSRSVDYDHVSRSQFSGDYNFKLDSLNIEAQIGAFGTGVSFGVELSPDVGVGREIQQEQTTTYSRSVDVDTTTVWTLNQSGDSSFSGSDSLANASNEDFAYSLSNADNSGYSEDGSEDVSQSESQDMSTSTAQSSSQAASLSRSKSDRYSQTSSESESRQVRTSRSDGAGTSQSLSVSYGQHAANWQTIYNLLKTKRDRLMLKSKKAKRRTICVGPIEYTPFEQCLSPGLIDCKHLVPYEGLQRNV